MAKRKGRTGLWVLLGTAAVGLVMFVPNLIGAAMVGNNITASFRGLRFNGVTGEPGVYRLQMTLILRLINPTSFNAKIDFISVNVVTPGGLPFADINRTSANYVIPPRSDQDVNLPVELNLTTAFISVMMPALIAAIVGGAQGLTLKQIGEKVKTAIPGSLKVSGNIRVNNIRVPVSQTLTVIKTAAPAPAPSKTTKPKLPARPVSNPKPSTLP